MVDGWWREGKGWRRWWHERDGEESERGLDCSRGFFFFFHNASGSGGRSAPEVFSSPLLSLTLLLSPPGISLRKTHRPWGLSRSAYEMGLKRGTSPVCERKVESESGGKHKEAGGVCSNRTVEHIAWGTRLLLLLQMVWRRFRQIDVSLYSLPVVYIYVALPCHMRRMRCGCMLV